METWITVWQFKIKSQPKNWKRVVWMKFILKHLSLITKWLIYSCPLWRHLPDDICQDWRLAMYVHWFHCGVLPVDFLLLGHLHEGNDCRHDLNHRHHGPQARGDRVDVESPRVMSAMCDLWRMSEWIISYFYVNIIPGAPFLTWSGAGQSCVESLRRETWSVWEVFGLTGQRSPSRLWL